MSNAAIAEAPEVDYLNMSDEDIANIDPNTVNVPVESDTDPEDTQAAPSGTDGDAAGEPSEATSQEEAADEGEAAADEDNASGSDAKSESTDKEPEPESAEEVDYKAEYSRIIAPFKANGRDITVKSVDDAIALMQMGANYNKKMSALKPNLKLMKMLENNGLLNEAKIGYLIDLEKKNPAAINKLMTDSGMDPLDLDTEKAGDYKPPTYTVDDKELELDTVLEDIQDTPSYNRTLDIVSNKWDGQSKQVIANSPQLLKVINSHVQAGIYDLISKEIESERTFGRLVGMSDIEAYRQIGDSMQARGGFNHLAIQGQQTQPKPVVVQPKPKMADEDKLREKKRAASPPKPAVSTQTKMDYNPLSLSDDAFSKLVNDKYL